MTGEKRNNDSQEIFLKMTVKDLAAAGLDENTLEILLGLSQKEKAQTRKRQAEGIARAREKGVKLGRPEAAVPDNFDRIAAKWESKGLPLETAVNLCGVSQSTFFRWLKKYRESTAES